MGESGWQSVCRLISSGLRDLCLVASLFSVTKETRSSADEMGEGRLGFEEYELYVCCA